MRAKACLKCHEYVMIHAGNPVSQQNVKKFELVHSGHSLVISDYFEIKDSYKRFDPNKKVDVTKPSVII